MLKKILFDHVHDGSVVFYHNDCLEKFYDFNVDLARVKPLTCSYFLHDFVIDKEDPDMVWVYIILDKLVQELQDQYSAMI